MIEDLGRQVAQKAIEAAEWKARAIIAEATIEQIKAEQPDDEGDVAPVVSLVSNDEEGDKT
jgi:hypothetical protein